MSEKWLSETLCSFDEKVRVERGPQVVELDCTDDNLSDTVTHANYQIGTRDALGRLIRPKEGSEKAKKQEKIDEALGIKAINKGEKMACVDQRQVMKPHLWKIYQSQDREELNRKTGEFEVVTRFIKVDEKLGKDEALAAAKAIYEGMK